MPELSPQKGFLFLIKKNISFHMGCSCSGLGPPHLRPESVQSSSPETPTCLPGGPFAVLCSFAGAHRWLPLFPHPTSNLSSLKPHASLPWCGSDPPSSPQPLLYPISRADPRMSFLFYPHLSHQPLLPQSDLAAEQITCSLFCFTSFHVGPLESGITVALLPLPARL